MPAPSSEQDSDESEQSSNESQIVVEDAMSCVIHYFTRNQIPNIE